MATPDQGKYLLRPKDDIEISFYKEPNLTKHLVVWPDGKIPYPLIGEVQAAGKTVKQLRAYLFDPLSKMKIAA